MQLTRSSSDPMAFSAQPFWQQCRSFTSPKEMPCDKDRKPTERDEAGSISSSDQLDLFDIELFENLILVSIQRTLALKRRSRNSGIVNTPAL